MAEVPEAHREAERRAVEAEFLLRGPVDAETRAEAERLYAEAATLEEEALAAASDAPARLRSMLAVNAASLWFKAKRWDAVERVASAQLDTGLTARAETHLKTLRAQARALGGR